VRGLFWSHVHAANWIPYFGGSISHNFNQSIRLHRLALRLLYLLIGG